MNAARGSTPLMTLLPRHYHAKIVKRQAIEVDVQASLRLLETPGAIDLVRAWSRIKGSALRRAFIAIAEAAAERQEAQACHEKELSSSATWSAKLEVLNLLVHRLSG